MEYFPQGTDRRTGTWNIQNQTVQRIEKFAVYPRKKCSVSAFNLAFTFFPLQNTMIYYKQAFRTLLKLELLLKRLDYHQYMGIYRPDFE